MSSTSYPSDQEAAEIKLPPHSRDAEQSVLGGLLLDNASMDGVTELLVEKDFYIKPHQLIFRAMRELNEKLSPFDPLILSNNLKELGLLEAIGGQAYLYELGRNTPSATNIRAYAEIVRDRSVRRQLIEASNRIAESAYYPEGRTTDELLNEAEQQVFKIAESRPKFGGPQHITDIASQVINVLESMDVNASGITGLSTGFTDLDEVTSGLQPADLVIVAGRPSMGKTTFAMNLVENAAVHTGRPVLVFSMEMPSSQLMMRIVSSLGRVEQNRLRSGNLEDEDWDRITSTVRLIKDTKLFIDDTPGLSPNEMRTRTRRLVREQGEDPAVIMVDYLQLMRVPGNSENRTAEISEISRSLKALAKEFNCPVVALSQLNRGLEQRTNKRPIMSDLRESGAIEQDADVIAFVYRDEVYHPDNPDNKGLAEIIIGKQRNGPIGSVHLLFVGQNTRFENLAPESLAQYREAGMLYGD